MIVTMASHSSKFSSTSPKLQATSLKPPVSKGTGMLLLQRLVAGNDLADAFSLNGNDMPRSRECLACGACFDFGSPVACVVGSKALGSTRDLTASASLGDGDDSSQTHRLAQEPH